MIEYLILECPNCEARRAVPVVEVDSEETVRTIAKHLLSAHPEIGPAGRDPDIDRTIEEATIVESNQRLGERGWTTEPLTPDGGGESPGGNRN